MAKLEVKNKENPKLQQSTLSYGLPIREILFKTFPMEDKKLAKNMIEERKRLIYT
jgi:hypothetical protein